MAKMAKRQQRNHFDNVLNKKFRGKHFIGLKALQNAIQEIGKDFKISRLQYYLDHHQRQLHVECQQWLSDNHGDLNRNSFYGELRQKRKAA